MSLNWQDIQKNTFTNWCNSHLKDRGMHIKDLQQDLKDGVLLINLLEIISNKSLGRYNRHPKVPNQKYENNAIAIDFVKAENIKIVNIGSTDITDGNLRIILGLIWTLILRYQVNKGEGDGKGAKDELLRWVRSKIPDYNIQNFTKDWNDGKALCALNNALDPSTCRDHSNLNPANKENNCSLGIDTAFNNLGIPKIISPDALAHPKVDEQSVMTYISFFRNAEGQGKSKQDEKERLAALTRAYGPGLVEGVVGQPSDFVVETPKGAGKLEIKVDGPKSTAVAKVTKTDGPNGTARYDVSYNPTEPGEYKVSVTLDGIHIPGSIFTVRVLDAVSLGGEGKIRVFYSTTSSNAKGRSDVVDLQRLLEQKQIHKRPDFEPWIPVDVMEKDDREAVFTKAGTKKLPIVFIDDKYVGDFDTCQDLEETGKLDVLLAYNKRK